MLALFIDDDAINRNVMAAMLASVDVVMEQAEDGPKGLEKIDAEDYDFILVDLRMPVMDGLEVVRRIRRRGDAKAAAPVIVVTADGSDRLAAQCLEAGADAMVAKPVEMSVLFNTLGEVLATRS